MQNELDALSLPVPIHLLGVNLVGYEAGNAAICQGRDLPWLQDTAEQNATGKWSALAFHLIILDAQNQFLADADLSAKSLATQLNYDELKAQLVAAAEAQ